MGFWVEGQQPQESWLKGVNGLRLLVVWQVLRLRCASLRMTRLWDVEENGRASLDTPPFPKSGKGRAPRFVALRERL